MVQMSTEWWINYCYYQSDEHITDTITQMDSFHHKKKDESLKDSLKAIIQLTFQMLHTKDTTTNVNKIPPHTPFPHPPSEC